MPRPDKENTHAPRPSSSRHRKVSARAQYTLGAKATAAQILLTKKRQKAKRKVLRHRQNEDALTVELPGDTDVVRQLRTALARTRGERNAAEASASRPARPKGPAVGSIPKPSNMTKVTINFIRRKLKLSGDKNDEKWNDLRAEVRRFMDAGLLDMSIGWKAQDDRPLIKIRDARNLPLRHPHPRLAGLLPANFSSFQVTPERTTHGFKGDSGWWRLGTSLGSGRMAWRTTASLASDASTRAVMNSRKGDYEGTWGTDGQGSSMYEAMPVTRHLAANDGSTPAPCYQLRSVQTAVELVMVVTGWKGSSSKAVKKL
ncbi:hypothetical protein FB45DRAFT_863217 [Roridomyces roridus]|uniref:Uncharacterized protein n=1 Tax=Roridomyces roridus TaxID=1738132 RepID=A0AAD7C8X9_9AGAR|nr:hypothetical protein FB45DRAFT_863217 [Roridomyces roridus]